jgi:hypothetical protein
VSFWPKGYVPLTHTHTQILKNKIIIRIRIINHPIPIPGAVLKKRKFQF